MVEKGELFSYLVFKHSLLNQTSQYPSYMRIFDETYLKCFPVLTTPSMWKIAGVLALPFEYQSEDIFMVSEKTGLSVQTILQTLGKSHHFFDVWTQRLAGPQPYIWTIRIKPIVLEFLLDESRSRILYFAYRSSVIRAVRSKLMDRLKFGCACLVY